MLGATSFVAGEISKADKSERPMRKTETSDYIPPLRASLRVCNLG